MHLLTPKATTVTVEKDLTTTEVKIETGNTVTERTLVAVEEVATTEVSREIT